MPSPSRTNRFQSFTPLRSTTGSLRRLKTAFSPTRNSLRSASPTSITTSATTSPLTRNCSPHSYRSSGSSSIRQLLAVRRKPSVLEFEMEEEKHLFSQELDVLEPRPSLTRGATGEIHVVGIFEVLDGKC
ncbi:hypothetical protein BDW02DRAFT_29604 [Decorospora gaudefroyi]|uniref:Uncharacterized protein n=1 Tax=Decorospora gaudefroyi TaxID=184978 RepID=A0A6A5K3R0_9PLEO|nr:hypothetical protein BDW02DRAFT_29604 [Decorospora gaudefroyi]